MNPSDLRTEILKLCEAFAAAAQTGNKLVIEAIAAVVKAKVEEFIPDELDIITEARKEEIVTI